MRDDANWAHRGDEAMGYEIRWGEIVFSPTGAMTMTPTGLEWTDKLRVRYEQLCNEREEGVGQDSLFVDRDWLYYTALLIAFVREDGVRAGIIGAASGFTRFDFFQLLKTGFMAGIVYAHDETLPGGIDLDKAQRLVSESKQAHLGHKEDSNGY